MDTSRSILVVDDMMAQRKILRKHLTEIGFKNVTEAGNGQEALTLLQKGEVKIDVVVSDWNMPEMNGITLLKSIRAEANESLSKMPFLMVTAEGDASTIMEAMDAGASAYLVKPFTKDTFAAKLLTVFKMFNWAG